MKNTRLHIILTLALTLILTLVSCGAGDGVDSESNNVIKYELDGGTLDNAPTTYSSENLPNLAKLIPTKEGFVFAGWFTSPEYNKTPMFTATTTGEVTLYAKWISPYIITYEFNGGVGEDFPTTYINGDDFYPQEYIPTKEDHIFLGWYFDEDFEQTAIFFEDTVGDYTLYAKWVHIPTKISDIPDRAKGYLGEGTSFTVNLSDYIDKNDNQVSYEAASSDTSVASVAVDGDELTVTLLKNDGTSTISVSVYVNETYYFSLEFDATAKNYTKIACIGDSLTALRPPYTPYPSYIQDYLGAAYTVHNAGKSGYGITSHGKNGKYTTLQEHQACLNFAPEILIIMIGTNDAKGWYEDFNGGEGNAESVFKDDYKELIKIYRTAFPDIEIYLVSSPSVNEFNTLGIPKDIVDGDINRMQLEIAEELGLPILDLHSMINPTSTYYFLDDGAHFTNAGASYVANLILNFVKTH